MYPKILTYTQIVTNNILQMPFLERDEHFVVLEQTKSYNYQCYTFESLKALRLFLGIGVPFGRRNLELFQIWILKKKIL